MPRKKKQQIKTNDKTSLEGLLQETYNDACSNINDVQNTINNMTNAAEVVDIDDLTKIAREKSNALKVKDSAIKIKLEIAKLQNDILKHSGNAEAAINERTNGSVTIDDFKAIREMIKNSANDGAINDD